MNVLIQIRQVEPQLRPAEQRIARVVLQDPAAAVDYSITTLAELSSTSVATVNRFCRSVGCEGYAEFRRRLAAEAHNDVAGQQRFGVSDSNIEPSDSVGDVVAKVALHEAQAIEETAASTDVVVLDSVAERITAARRVDIFGVASSSLAAMDLQQKLHRIGMNVTAWSDAHLGLPSAALLTEADVAIGISHSGRTIEVHQFLELAAASGATTVAITNHPESPIGQLADLLLTTAARETPFRPGAMSSRIAQLAVIDFVFVRVAQRCFDRLSGSLAKTFEAVQSHRTPPQRTGRGS